MSTGTRLERLTTIRSGTQPNVLWLEVTDSDGATGLGETYYVPGAVEAVVHDMAAPLLLGTDVTRIERAWQTLFSCANFYGFAGAEMRAFSAIDIALWDLAGRRSGSSISTLLGGRVRDSVRVYNTCVDTEAHPDQTRWLDDAGDLAKELLAAGFSGMKVWPWDRFAPQIASASATGPAGWSAMGPAGADLTPQALHEGRACLQAVRDAVGMDIDLMVEGHARWDVNAALQICRAIEELRPTWIEDAIQPTSVGSLARLARETRVPQAVSERLIGKWAYRDVLEAGAAHLAMVDVGWAGGITEARKIATLAETFHVPIVPHDCVGPVQLAASLQLCAHAPGAKIMEVVRGFLVGWYRNAVDHAFEIVDGSISIPDAPGHGVSLLSELSTGPDAVRRVSER